MKYRLSLRNRPYYNILRKMKKWEGRLYSGKYRKIKIGDTIEFKNVEDKTEKRRLEVEIRSIHVFPTFKDAFKMIDIQGTIPGYSLTRCLEIYHSYYPEDTITSGVVFFGIRLIRVKKEGNKTK